EMKQRACCHLSLFTGQSVDYNVQQSPPGIVKSLKQSAELTCSHSISSYDTILWYQQSGEMGALKLIGYIYYAQPEKEKNFDRFNMTGDGSSKGSLIITDLRSEDSAVYYCAASLHSGVEPHSSSTKTSSAVSAQEHSTPSRLGCLVTDWRPVLGASPSGLTPCVAG
uniref:Ig-like domain-containing protein n=1 Tax=Scleropages formosus TaxID=113540 RepID=A0A8C9RB19_SCLFO